jgi:glycosyltransferase involved in cell wall biosynthesis
MSLKRVRGKGVPAEADYPRVLILGPHFDLVTGSGITLANLFRGWPAERLAVASSYRSEMNPAPCGQEYLLGQAERQWIKPLRFARRFGRPQPEQFVTANALQDPGRMSPAGGAFRRYSRSAAKAVFHAGVRALGSDDYFRRLSPSEALLDWSQAFKPDLIYTFLGGLPMIRLTLELADRLKSPIALHIMDDWPQSIYRHGLLGWRLRAQNDRSLRAIVDRAAARLAISDAMANEYSKRYGRDWAVFHNPTDLERWSKVRRNSWGIGDEFKLVYSGRIGPGTEASLLDVSQAVALLRSEGRNVRLDVHSWYFDQTDDGRFSGFDGVAVHGAIPDADMPAVLAQADTLVLPFDFHGDAARLFRLSFPTKAPGYMASGTPVLVYAPPGHAVAEEASDSGWGYVVSEAGVSAVVGAIRRLMDDETLRQELGQKAIQEAEERYDSDSVRARFAATLNRAACSRRTL